MKKSLMFSLLVLAVLLTIACKSKPDPVTPPPRPVSTVETIEPVEVIEQSTDNIRNPEDTHPPVIVQQETVSIDSHNRHSSGVILDGSTTYVVKRGDTLNNISRQMYRDGSYYPLIMMVSGNVVDPDMILPEQTLVIPDLGTNMNDASAREKINSYFHNIAGIEEQRGRKETADMIRLHTR